MQEGEKVDAEILKDLGISGGGAGPDLDPGQASGQGIIKALEDHKVPLTGKQLQALLYLKWQGGKYAQLADQYMELRKYQAGPSKLIEALEVVKGKAQEKK